MPWKVVKSGNKYKVVGIDSGKVHGTHDSADKARAQVKALYANVPEATKKKA